MFYTMIVDYIVDILFGNDISSCLTAPMPKLSEVVSSKFGRKVRNQMKPAGMSTMSLAPSRPLAANGSQT